MTRRLLVLAFAAALPLGAQSVIDAGMPKAQVVARLGAPAFERTAGDAAYLFYQNGCERTCGMHDVVMLDKGVVVDAVFRSPKRQYSGTSSSPRMIAAAEARRAKATVPAAAPDAPITIELKSTTPATAPKPPQLP
jgi:hypothetical protein